jgi:hypothetical protein
MGPRSSKPDRCSLSLTQRLCQSSHELARNSAWECYRPPMAPSFENERLKCQPEILSGECARSVLIVRVPE